MLSLTQPDVTEGFARGGVMRLPNAPVTKPAAATVTKPVYAVMVLISASLILRLAFASAMGLGIDESYMVAAGRHIQAGYYDHPPLAWWLSWGAANLLGCDSPLAVRLPFLLLFAASTWLMFQYASTLFSQAAGLWSACLMNLVPVLGITTGSFVLPDGPLIATLLGFALLLTKAETSAGVKAWALWLGAGALAGLALDSKYTAILPLISVVMYFIWQDRWQLDAPRRWLHAPHPYMAALLALALFAPVLVWNAQHDWISFAFQGARIGGKFHLFGLFSALLAQAIVMLPWILIPLLLCATGARRFALAQRAQWLPIWLGLPPVVFFLAISPWTHVLPHWPIVGFTLLLPLLGAAIARQQASPWLRRAVLASAVFTVAGSAVVASEVRFNWLPGELARFGFSNDPAIQMVDWWSLKSSLAATGFLSRRNTVIAGLRWHEAAKIDYVIGGTPAVICLCEDPREYGIAAPSAAFHGRDVILVATHADMKSMIDQYGGLFSSIDELQAITVFHAGRPAMVLPLFLGHALRAGIPRPGMAK